MEAETEIQGGQWLSWSPGGLGSAGTDTHTGGVGSGCSPQLGTIMENCPGKKRRPCVGMVVPNVGQKGGGTTRETASPGLGLGTNVLGQKQLLFIRGIPSWVVNSVLSESHSPAILLQDTWHAAIGFLKAFYLLVERSWTKKQLFL